VSRIVSVLVGIAAIWTLISSMRMDRSSTMRDDTRLASR
jgi:uncharacterized membrane protein YuzA (DUF378 family)